MSQVHFVIHHIDYALTMAQAKIAADAGADGIFLISHNGLDDDVADMACELKGVVNDFGQEMEVGVNLLSTAPADALSIAIARDIRMLWVDGGGITGKGAGRDALEMFERLKDMPHYKRTQVFAGVAFKHQAPEADPPQAARHARILGFMPTTSGEATGRAPEVEKIAAMAKAADGELAIASGMTVENVWQFVPHLSQILVATGISRDFHHFDPPKAKAFVRAVRDASRSVVETRQTKRT